MSEKPSLGMADMALEDGPDKAERDERQRVRSMGRMSLDLTPQDLTQEITAACARTASGAIKTAVRDKLSGTAEDGYQWDGRAVAKMSEDQLAETRKALAAGGLKFDE